MKVFHGSYTGVSEIDLGFGRSNLDFGKGFYVINIRSQAEYWATRTGRYHQTDGIVSEFEFYENAFDHFELKTLRFLGYTEQWLDFVVLNRDPASPIPAHDYDIVEGPVANDDVNDRITDYLAGTVSKADFLKELAYHKPTHQICLCTVRSLQMIKATEKKHYIDVKHISKPIIKQLITERQIDEPIATDMLFDSKTFAKLADASTGLYERPWQEIYEMLKTELTTKGATP